MKAYAPTGVYAIYNSDSGHLHEANKKEGRMVVDCDTKCVSYLIERLGFGPTPDTYQRNQAELDEEKKAEKEGSKTVQEMGKALADVAKEIIETRRVSSDPESLPDDVETRPAPTKPRRRTAK